MKKERNNEKKNKLKRRVKSKWRKATFSLGQFCGEATENRSQNTQKQENKRKENKKEKKERKEKTTTKEKKNTKETEKTHTSQIQIQVHHPSTLSPILSHSFFSFCLFLYYHLHTDR